jgi:hypothetical protein
MKLTRSESQVLTMINALFCLNGAKLKQCKIKICKILKVQGLTFDVLSGSKARIAVDRSMIENIVYQIDEEITTRCLSSLPIHLSNTIGFKSERNIEHTYSRHPVAGIFFPLTGTFAV